MSRDKEIQELASAIQEATGCTLLEALHEAQRHYALTNIVARRWDAEAAAEERAVKDEQRATRERGA